MITHFSKEQEIQLALTLTSWLEKGFNQPGIESFNAAKCNKAFKQLYRHCGLDEPEVIITDSPPAMQTAYQDWVKNDGSQERNEAVSLKIDEAICMIIFSAMNEAENVLDEELMMKVMNYLITPFGKRGMETIAENNGVENDPHDYYADFGMLCCCNFFRSIGILTSQTALNLDIVINCIDAGAYLAIQGQQHCVISKYPVFVDEFGSEGFNNTKRAAVEFADNHKLHYVKGRFIEREIFDKAQNIETAQEIFFKESNEDVKSIICTIIRENFGPTGLLKMLKAELVKEQNIRHRDGYTETLRLYKTKQSYPFVRDINGTLNNPYAWLEFSCPSTGTVYLIDTYADFKSPLEAAKYHRPKAVPVELPYQWNLFAN